MRSLKTIGVFVFLKKRKTQTLVGRLYKIDQKFTFTYEDSYLNARYNIALGPEFPLTQREFSSNQLFPSLEDRIPSTQNPAYSEYCLAMGIDPKEQDPFILLSTVGSKGPSSFIFYPIFKRDITSKNIVEFRNMLGLTTREFSAVFEFSQNSLNALERGRITGSEILKRLEILLNFPDVTSYFLLVNSGYLIHEKWVFATEKLKEMLQK
ncbi:MAG TPA: HipA N-terminal domain-containing protein [Rhabdochlamydiaceae bacterium]|nr:HipA N-terminal domain-containing protein [Rhabdochlamydiaceae bacterium]HSX38154.1 HipA N-terminal domain-containing protein [Chlamydiales bacterium]